MASVTTLAHEGGLIIRGRGGASLHSDGVRVLAFGGSDRSGELFADMYALSALGVAAAAPPTAPPALAGHAVAPLCVGWNWRPASAGGAWAAAGGARGAALFGGINYKEDAALAGLFELRGDAWRGVTGEVAPSGVPPSARTGHTLSAVPPPLLRPPRGGGGAGAGAPLPAPVPLGSVLGGDPAEAVAVLFGGSSPEEGPQNDLFLLRAGEAGPAAGACGGWRYGWHAPATRGAPPAPRELHAAFVLPAVCELVEGGCGAGDDAPPTGATPVRVLRPPALVVHGGRCEDGAPRPDLCVLDLAALTWAPQVRSPHALCAAAAAAEPGGEALLLLGGLAGGGLSGELLRVDAAGCGLDAAAWAWRVVPLARPIKPRFAAAAVAVRGEQGAAGGVALYAWAGMEAAEDLAEALLVSLP
jgi:hypothetical protein